MMITGGVIRAALLAACLALGAGSIAAQCVAPAFDAAVVIAAGGPGPAGEIASGDLNGDGRTDLLVPRYITNTISLIFGSPTGTPTVVLLTSVQRPLAVGVADFNHDSKLDLAVSHETSSTSVSVAILLGDGIGGFGAPTEFAASLSRPLVTADFNNDSHPDVFLGNSSTNNSQMLLGNGSGGLAAPFLVGIPNNSKAVAADFNGDGKLDLASEYDGTESISVVLGDGTGHFAAPTFFPINRTLFGNIATGDFNSDSKLDLVVSGQSNGISVLLGNGTGGFGQATSFSTGFSTIGLAVGDFNADGKPDVTTSGSFLVGVLIGDGFGGFASSTGYPLSETPVNIVTGDFNGDNKTDVGTVNCNSCANASTILFGDGSGSLRSVKLLDVGLSPFSITSGDLNADGKLDLAVANVNHDNVSIFIANGVGNFNPPTNFVVGDEPRSVALGDINGDQKLDIVTANFSAGTVSILFGNGLGGVSPPGSTAPVPGFNPSTVAIADFNNDSKPDLVVGYLNASIVTILPGNGGGGFESPASFPVPSGAQNVATHDFNGDGKADLAVATITGVSVLLGNGSGGFGPTTTMPTSSTAYAVVVGDFNRDGKADLVATLGNSNSALVYLGDGLGAFGPSKSFTTGQLPVSAALADFNGDRDPDLATGNITNSASVLLGNGVGGLGAAVTYPNGGVTTRSMTSGDFNADGRPDLAMANQSGTVSLMFNACAAAAPAPILSVSDVSVTEGDSGSANATFTVSLSAPADRVVSVSYYSAAADAEKNVDYQTAQGRVSFAAGITSQTITIPINGDTLDEFDEQFSVLLAYPLNANITQARAQGTILDNDPLPTVSITDVALNETNAGTVAAVFTVSLSAPSGRPISLAIATADDSANGGADYQPISATLNFSPGQTSQTASVLIVGDDLAEADERFFVNLTNPVNVELLDAQGVGTILNDDTNIQLSASAFSVNETDGSIQITVTRTGVLSGNSSVSYATSNGTASGRSDYSPALGTLRFAPNETSKVVTVFIINDSLLEGLETFNFDLSAAFGATLGSPSTAAVTITSDDLTTGPNPIDTASFFVRQHYIDFLSREPDAAGLAFWSNQITECEQPGATCNAEVRRINVSAAFFVSIEFQETGYLAYRAYKAAYGDAAGQAMIQGQLFQIPVPMITLNEFLADSNAIGDGVVVGATDWQAKLENNKAAYFAAFVERPRFLSEYPVGMNAAAFVTKLDMKAGNVLSTAERNSLAEQLQSAQKTRAQVVRAVAEHGALALNESRRAFVLMQYFGYLRRNPNDAPEPTLDFTGYNFWLTKLNQFNGNYITAEMVKAFITSDEYRQRFGP